VATRATSLSLLALDLDDPMGSQPGASLGDKLLNPIDRLNALGDIVVLNHGQDRFAVHAAPLVQSGRAFRRAPTESISR
jgi:hypothetical protein